MVLQAEIKLLKQPRVADAFGFTFRVNGVPVLEVSKTFGAAGADVIAIGANVSATAANVLANLEANDVLAGLAYSVSGQSVFATLTADGDIVLTALRGTQDYVSVYEQDLVPIEPFDVHNFAVEIIDTYDNDRLLFEEFAQADSLKLTWDGGEDLYQPMMTSRLSFSMAVLDHADGGFLHLLTGDETRFLVKLKNIDEAENAILLWQGFILPDLYSEPWKKGVPFIEFTATDAIALLKGKKFKPWFYYQRFTLPEFFAYVMEKTGLLQEFYVSPALVNVGHGEGYRWRDVCVNLRPYTDGKKYEGLYDMLERVLVSQGMQLFAYRGKWFLQGLTRRQESEGLVEVYHPDGEYKEILTLQYEVATPLFSATPPIITAETPWKKVALNFSTESPQNLLPDDVVVKEYFGTRYVWGGFDMTNGYLTTFLDMWKKVGGAFLNWSGRDKEYFRYWPNVLGFTGVNEATALVNYFECYSKPYVTTERRYEFEIEAELRIDLISGDGSFEDDLKDGKFDRILNFQIFNNGVEIISNRPGFDTADTYVFDKDNMGPFGNTQNGKFSLKREFSVAEDGVLTIRFLPSIGSMPAIDVDLWYVRVTALKINVLGEVEDTESAVAVRDINYTKEFEIDVDITCTVDGSVDNSFAIGARVLDQYVEIPVPSVEYFYNYHFFEPSTYVYLMLCRWPIEETFQDLIFRADLQKSLFLKRADGTDLHYFSIYSKTVEGVHYLAAYHDYTSDLQGKPVLPKDFVKLPQPIPSGVNRDYLMMMLSFFVPEDNNKRALWKIYGFDDDTADTYMRTLARACHSVRPDVCFSIDCLALALVFPLQHVLFRYLGENKLFIPTRIEMDLFRGKTQITMKEAKLQQIDDITFE